MKYYEVENLNCYEYICVANDGKYVSNRFISFDEKFNDNRMDTFHGYRTIDEYDEDELHEVYKEEIERIVKNSICDYGLYWRIDDYANGGNTIKGHKYNEGDKGPTIEEIFGF